MINHTQERVESWNDNEIDPGLRIQQLPARKSLDPVECPDPKRSPAAEPVSTKNNAKQRLKGFPGHA
jgi:hypothetical protein